MAAQNPDLSPVEGEGERNFRNHCKKTPSSERKGVRNRKTMVPTVRKRAEGDRSGQQEDGHITRGQRED